MLAQALPIQEASRILPLMCSPYQVLTYILHLPSEAFPALEKDKVEKKACPGGWWKAAVDALFRPSTQTTHALLYSRLS